MEVCAFSFNNEDTFESDSSFDFDTDEEIIFSGGITPTTSNKRKRSHSCSDNEPSEKVFVTGPELTQEYSKLLNLSDEVLLEILKNCNSSALIALSRTCQRFKTLVWDRQLWRDFDFVDTQLTAIQIKKRLQFTNKETRHIKIRGLIKQHPAKDWRNNTITKRMLARVTTKCPELESLEIYEGYLNFQRILITDFPKTLKRLILSGCEVKFPQPPRVFFNKIDSHMKLLEELSLQGCGWFETHDLIIFSKLPQLKKLTLRGCNSLKDCVPYGSIAARFGFHKLQVLDIRDTPISDSDIQCFNITTSLRELLMECPEHLRNQNATAADESSTGDGEPGPSRNIVQQERPLLPNEVIDQNAEEPRPINNGAAAAAAAGAEAAEQNNGDDDQDVVAAEINIDNGGAAAVNHENPIIRIVVRERNLNERAAAANENNGEELNERINEPGPANGLRVVPPPEQQQLIIVRGHHGGADGHRNRITWQVVNCSRRVTFGHVRRPGHFLFEPPPITLISDRGIQCFGLPKNNHHDGIIWIRAEMRSPDTLLEKMVIRHYKLVTDISLRHLANSAPNLKLLDVTGTSVTADGVATFKAAKPNCVVLSDFDN